MANTCRDDMHLPVLFYWIYQIRSQIDLEPACRIIARGFDLNGSRLGATNCPFLLLETCVQHAEQGLCLITFIARKIIHKGENKPYIIDYLNTL